MPSSLLFFAFSSVSFSSVLQFTMMYIISPSTGCATNLLFRSVINTPLFYPTLAAPSLVLFCF
ncbi:hypothetical protein BKA57DRAFT_467566 [Linnemannia elongata]|nr:hypothetical protein BKA57DRAFT_467566 [Linnemannia elongata]